MLSDLINIIDERALSAGFKSSSHGYLAVVSDENWPEPALENQLHYWYSDFASILLVEVKCETYSEAWALSRRAETYLDAALLQREKNGSVVDGYLVLAMTQMHDGLKPFMIEVEKDTRFVRKHVVYEGAEGWVRYQRITPLGLVSSLSGVQDTVFTPDSAASSQLLESLDRLGSRGLARLHGKEWNLNE
ncbi:MAG: hypothetical protein HWE39_08965 [Oceanospirillaceae bacterium]|nr:hypothetical protein [Oceanospirillaceae bacterium]